MELMGERVRLCRGSGTYSECTGNAWENDLGNARGDTQGT